VGNLLVDFQIFSAAGGFLMSRPPLDAFNIVGDSVSSVFAYGPSVPAVGQTSSLGLATAFTITPVPEPSSIILLAFATAFAAGKMCRRTQKGRKLA
jgi:hypothetical protein